MLFSRCLPTNKTRPVSLSHGSFVDIMLLMGPPGSGKSMLAQRFAGVLPTMTVDEALESAAVASLAGGFALERWAQRPTCSPHHTASAVALVGGGSPPRPGGHLHNKAQFQLNKINNLKRFSSELDARDCPN